MFLFYITILIIDGVFMTNDKFCYIFGAAPVSAPLKFNPRPAQDFVIAADAGYNFLTQQGIKPDLLVGDLDSLGFAPSDVELVKFPTVKDDTDMMLAINEGKKRGFNKFIIYGGMGGKTEFTLANLQILSNIVNSGELCYFVGSGSLITAVKNGSLNFSEEFHGRVSVFAAGEAAHGVTLSGLKYTLTDAVLRYDCPLGVSNEFINSKGSISVTDGMLYVIYDDCNPMFF
ncbi:MAG: thiamine diphosphokinase [Ruminococcaceae bacterium]|nr:thiamine diphosphokinase [Oscillospiraceae bacterium]